MHFAKAKFKALEKTSVTYSAGYSEVYLYEINESKSTMNVVISRRCDTRSAARLDFYAYNTYTDTNIIALQCTVCIYVT